LNLLGERLRGIALLDDSEFVPLAQGVGGYLDRRQV
jgi:hypothetical protein